ncbi:MAG: haloacid dehalogenase [Epsilonproteobacteria bacterium]|nr:MAG: haloacid dehalogenase [Campylobacterota bacterium]
MTIEIPHYKNITITDIVCDYNGTIAKDGIVLPQIKTLFDQLSKVFTLHVITADTFGSVKAQLEGYGAEIKILTSSDHTLEKADFITTLGAEQSAAMGNGNNDSKMLLAATIGIAVLGDEGCSKAALLNADIICQNSADALALFLEPNRLIATLRR